MNFTDFPLEALNFFAELAVNNNKSWFEMHRSDYDNYVIAPSRDFVVALGERLRELAPNVMTDPRVN